MITGRSSIIAHLGVPTESFRAPMIYNPWFEHRGIDCHVVPMGCEPTDFAEFLPLVFRLRNMRGALITMPHKVSVVALLDAKSRDVEVCGACNAVRRESDGTLFGDMFDGEGFVRGMKRKGHDPAARSALVVGAGGVGSAIAASLAAAGAARIVIHDVRRENAEALVSRMRDAFPETCIALSGVMSTGGHVAAARMLGADLAYIGTRFIATTESQAQVEYKDMLVDTTAADIDYTPKISGIPANFLIPSLEQNGLDPATMAPKTDINMGEELDEAKAWSTIWSAGQGVGSIRDVIPTAELVARLVQEYEAAKASVASW